MFCTKCGSKIKDDSTFCEHCGNKVNGVNENNSSQGSILFRRNNSFVGVIIGISIYIDGNLWKELRNSCDLEIKLPSGRHAISYKVWCRRMKTVEIDIKAGESYYFNFVPDYLWGGFKLGKDSKLN